MARCAVIDGTTVINVIEAGDDFALDGLMIIPTESAGIGWSYRGGRFVSAAAPLALMPDLSDRQFGEGLWRDGLIDFSAYLAFVGPGVIPDDLMAIINTLPDDNTGGPTPRKVALGLVTGAQLYEFDNPFVEPMRQAFERKDPIWTLSHFRERWLAWSTL